MSITLDKAYKEASDLRSSWEAIYTALTHGGYDISTVRPAIGDTSTESFNARMTLTFELFESLKPQRPNDINDTLLSSRSVEINSFLRVLTKKSAASPRGHSNAFGKRYANI